MHEHISEKLADILEYRAAFFDGIHDARKIVVEQDHVGRLLGDIGAGNPHGDADMRGLQRRRVVGAVAGDRRDVTFAFQRLDDAQFVGGAHAREDDVARVKRQSERHRRERAQLLAGNDRRLAVAQEADLGSDGLGGVRMVAGDHDHLHAGLMAGGHGARHLRPRRIAQADQPLKDQIVLQPLVRPVGRQIA